MQRQAAAGPASDVYRVIPDMLDALYASESSDKDSVHSDKDGNWYIHRDRTTSIVYLVPAEQTKHEDGVRAIVQLWPNNTTDPWYTGPLSEGLLIVQDQRPGCVRVMRSGSWEHATEPETYGYYDFLLRYNSTTRYYGPREFAASGGDVFTLTRNGDSIFVRAGDDSSPIIPDRISDWAWRAANVSTFDDDTRVRPKDIIDSGQEERGLLYDE
jgi:hypothetical protein